MRGIRTCPEERREEGDTAHRHNRERAKKKPVVTDYIPVSPWLSVGTKERAYGLFRVTKRTEKKKDQVEHLSGSVVETQHDVIRETIETAQGSSELNKDYTNENEKLTEGR